MTGDLTDLGDCQILAGHHHLGHGRTDRHPDHRGLGVDPELPRTAGAQR
ncbi:MAG: hypothetical protein WDM85_05900 [Caulobacteraceae bacterium]